VQCRVDSHPFFAYNRTTRMNTSLIKCTNCGQEIEISQALRHQIEEQVTESQKIKHKEDLERTQQETEEKIRKELESEKQKAVEESSKKVKTALELELRQAKEEAESQIERNKDLMNKLTEITKELREQRIKSDEAELKMQKQLMEEQDKIKMEAVKKAQEEQATLLQQKDKQIADAMKEVEDMKRKLQQGSQQAQGEVFELEFEKLLAEHYPNDKIEPVGKGIRGGDIIQEVWDRNGTYVGKILWELKNTKTWQEVWISKLKNDQRTINAEEAVLISEIIPDDMKTAGFRNSVWVTSRDFVFPLADTLRAKLIQFYIIKNSVKGKDEKMEILYSYLSGTEFKHRVEAIIEAFSNMQNEIEKEKRYFSNKWARDEKNIRYVIDNTIGMHGDLKGIIGNSLPLIKSLELLELEDGQ